jgi:hypothetical protein
LKRELTEELWFFRFEDSANISKINEVSMSLKGKQWTVFETSDKI